MSGITFLKQNPSKLGWDSPIRKMVCGLSFLIWLALLQTSLAVNVPGPNGTVVTQILSATSSNPEVKVVEDRDLGKILVYPPQPKEFTVKIIARIMYPDDQYLEKISTVMVGATGVSIESSEIRNSLILATLKVAPGASGGRFSITYENEDNPNHKGCNVRLLPVELLIHNGQGAANAIPEKDEETIGAFTVANLNDTDGDGTVDNGDNTVKKGAVGEDEEDLMKLIVKGPNLGRMKVTVASGNVEFWEKSTKETKIAKQGNTIFINGADLPKTMWVEATNHSNALRDIELKLGFEAPDGTLTDDLDKVKATAVWAEKTGFKNKLTDALWADAKNPLLNTFNNIYGGKFGIQFAGPPVNIQYAMGMEFTVKPNNIGNEPNVKFDVTRDIAFKDWTINGAVVALRPFLGKDDKFDPGDKSDDDSSDGEEDNTPENNHVYSIDGPGEGRNATHDQVVSRNNFEEYVRVSFDGNKPTGNNDSGSRCSENIPWHAFYWVQKDVATGKYNQRAGKTNQVDEGHLPLEPAPNP